MPVVRHQSRLSHPAEEVFAWHGRPGAFERLTPPWERVRVLERSGGLTDGSRVVIEIRRGPLRLRWVARHRDYEAGRRFADEQVKGPFRSWVHTHRFEPLEGGESLLEDHVDYRLPLGPLGQALAGRSVERTLARLFRFRHARTAADLARHRAVADRGPLRVAITGASGLIGESLGAFLSAGGHAVARLVRRVARGPDEIAWDPAAGKIDAARLAGVDAVVHLAGESVAAGRWTAARKRRILESRVGSTRLLAETLARLEQGPRVLVSASAIGYYGDRGDRRLTEESEPGRGFLAEVCQAWEAAAEPARRAGIRVVHPRIGLVLSGRGGALARMLLPFRLGLGGVVGSGRQVASWIALDDVVGAIHHLLFADGVAGPVNLAAPVAVPHRELVRTLGRVLRRPTRLPLPAAAVRVLLGEMGQALLLDGARVEPARLLAGGFRFLHPDLEGALRSELGR
jgi:uncharacterized protein (TIGR01777 family)